MGCCRSRCVGTWYRDYNNTERQRLARHDAARDPVAPQSVGLKKKKTVRVNCFEETSQAFTVDGRPAGLDRDGRLVQLPMDSQLEGCPSLGEDNGPGHILVVNEFELNGVASRAKSVVIEAPILEDDPNAGRSRRGLPPAPEPAELGRQRSETANTRQSQTTVNTNLYEESAPSTFHRPPRTTVHSDLYEESAPSTFHRSASAVSGFSKNDKGKRRIVTQCENGKTCVDLRFAHSCSNFSMASSAMSNEFFIDLTGHAGKRSSLRRTIASVDSLEVLENIIVMDFGAHTSKIGYGGEGAPSRVFPSNSSSDSGSSKQDYFVDVWAKAFAELSVRSKQSPVLVTGSPLISRAGRELQVQILFETFDVPSVHFASPAVLSLLSSGRKTGLAIDLGETHSHIVPVYESKRITQSMCSLDVAGKHLSDYMVQLLYNKNGTAPKWMDGYEPHEVLEIGQGVKEGLACAALQFDSAREVDAATYALPDGELIRFSSEPYQCAEALFQPAFLGRPAEKGLSECTLEAIMNCDAKLQSLFFSGMVLSGGTSLIPGLQERLVQDIAELVPDDTQIAIQAPPHRLHAAWHGGSLLSSMSSFDALCFSKEEYEESGPSAIHAKFF